MVRIVANPGILGGKRSQGIDVVSACEEDWGSYEDEDILAWEEK